MSLRDIRATALSIPFRMAFKHASAERASTQSVWVEAAGAGGEVGYGEGCPREYVSGESLHSAHQFIDVRCGDWIGSLSDVESLRHWVDAHRGDIDANPAAWCGVELALLDLFGKETGKPVETMLGMEELGGRFQYTAVIGDAEPRVFAAQLARYLAAGFSDFKIKLSGRADDAAKIAVLRAAGIAAEKVRADANNLWRDADSAIAHLAALDYRFYAIEEPLRAGDIDGMRRVARQFPCRIVLDESLLRVAQLDAFSADPIIWIAYLRVSKLGGLLRSLQVGHVARERGLGIIVGAHVGETGISTRAALTLAHALRGHVLAQEGAVGTHLLDYDVVQPSPVFGSGGMLDAAELEIGSRPGWGLQLANR